MPKCDPTKDYYACLEVSPTCSTADIKKQFHKLGRSIKCHVSVMLANKPQRCSTIQIETSARIPSLAFKTFKKPTRSSPMSSNESSTTRGDG